MCWVGVKLYYTIPYHTIPTPTADSNISTGMIRVTLNMAWSAVDRQGFSYCLESCHPELYIDYVLSSGDNVALRKYNRPAILKSQFCAQEHEYHN